MIWVRTGAEVEAVVCMFICALERQIQTTTAGERNEGKQHPFQLKRYAMQHEKARLNLDVSPIKFITFLPREDSTQIRLLDSDDNI